MEEIGEDLVRTRRLLNNDPTATWGFVVYRQTYDDDAEWARFMQYLNTRTRLGLEEYGNGALFERIDWQVQDNKERFGRVGYDALRR